MVAQPMYPSATTRQALGAAGHWDSIAESSGSFADPFAVPEPIVPPRRGDPNAALIGPRGRSRAEIAASDSYIDDDEAAFYFTTQPGMIPQSAAAWLKGYTQSQRAKLAAVDLLPEPQAFDTRRQAPRPAPIRGFAEGGDIYSQELLSFLDVATPTPSPTGNLISPPSFTGETGSAGLAAGRPEANFGGFVAGQLEQPVIDALVAQGYRFEGGRWVPPSAGLTQADFEEGVRRIRASIAPPAAPLAAPEPFAAPSEPIAPNLFPDLSAGQRASEFFLREDNVAQREQWAEEARAAAARREQVDAAEAAMMAELPPEQRGTLRDRAIAEGRQGYGGIAEALVDAYNTEIPVWSDFARDVVKPAARSFGDFFGDAVPGGAAYNLFADAVPLVPSTGQVAEASVPVTAGDVALELVPGVGTAPGLASFLRTVQREGLEAGVRSVAGALAEGSARSALADLPAGARRGVLEVPAFADEALQMAATAGRTVVPSSAPARIAENAPFGVQLGGGAPLDDLARQLIDAEDPADVVGMVRGLDLASQMELTLSVGKKDRQAVLDFGKLLAEAQAGDMAAATRLQNRLYAEATTLSKRVAQMTGETATEARQRAVTRTAQALGKTRDEQRALGNLPPIAGGAEVPEELGLARRVWNEALGVIGAPIAAKSTLSPPFMRQGMIRYVTNPKAAWKELVQSFANLPAEKTAQLMDVIRHDDWVRSTASKAAEDAIKQQRYLLGLGTGDIPNKGFTWLDVGGALLDPIDVDDLKNLSLEQVHKLARESGVAFNFMEDKEAIIRRMVTELQPEQLQGLNDSWVANKIRNAVPVKLSDRQMALQLNLNRTNWYRETASAMWDAGIREQEDYIRLRKLIEHATQRGSWSQGNVPFFFSTRALSGRVQFVADLMAEGLIEGIAKGGVRRPGAPREALKALTGMTAAASAMVGIPAALGIGEIEMNDGLPTLRIGRQHFDPYAGWNPIAKFMHRFVEDIGDQFAAKGRGDLSWADMPQSVFGVASKRTYDFLKNGVSPAIGKALPVVEGAVTGRTARDAIGQPVKWSDPRNLIDLYAPFILQDLYDAYREEGLKGVALQVGPSVLSMSANTYRSADSEAENLFGAKFDQLTYDQQQQVRASIGRPESDYQEARREGGGEQRAEQQKLGEEAFLRGEFPTNGPDKDLPSLWSNLGKEAYGARSQLGEQFKSMFAGFEPTHADKIIDGYYEQQKTNSIGRPDFGATAEAQKAYLDSLSRESKDGRPSDYDYMQSYLDFQRSQATPLRQAYLAHQDMLDEVGYYDLDDAAKAQLQKEMPQIEALSAWFYSGTDANEPASLMTPQAVEVFMAQNAQFGTNFPAKLQGTDLVINANEGTLAAYQAGGGIVAQYLAADTKQKAELRKKDDVMAWLAAFGYNVKLTNSTQLGLFNRINQQYGLGMTAEKAKDFK